MADGLYLARGLGRAASRLSLRARPSAGPVRVELTMRLAHEFGLWDQSGVTVAAPAPAGDADLQLVHDAHYARAVEAISRWAEHPDARDGLAGNQLRAARMFGLGTEDNPVFPGMHEASALVTGRP